MLPKSQASLIYSLSAFAGSDPIIALLDGVQRPVGLDELELKVPRGFRRD